MPAILIAGLLTNASYAAPAPMSDPADQTDTTFANEISIRAFFGLRSDQEFVKSLHSQGVSVGSPLPIPLTPAEASEMDRRDRVVLALHGLYPTMEAVPGFSGAWVEPSTGLATIAMATHDAAAVSQIRGEVTSVIADAHDPAVVQVENTLEFLRAKRLRIAGATESWRNRGISIVGLGVAEMENLVRVELDASTSDAADIALLQETYGGSGLQVVLAETSARASWVATGGAIAGGQRVYRSDGVTPCSVAYSNTSLSGSYYGVIAGHCGYGHSWRQGTLAGPSVGQDFQSDNGLAASDPTNCDCTDFGAVTGKQTNAYLTDAAGTLASVTKYGRTPASYALSRAVCFGGSTTADHICDIIRDPDNQSSFVNPWDGLTHTLVHGVRMYCTSLGGDSGGPLHTDGGTIWLGVLSNGAGTTPKDCHHSANYTNFSRAQFVAATIGNTIGVPGEF